MKKVTFFQIVVVFDFNSELSELHLSDIFSDYEAATEFALYKVKFYQTNPLYDGFGIHFYIKSLYLC